MTASGPSAESADLTCPLGAHEQTLSVICCRRGLHAPPHQTHSQKEASTAVGEKPPADREPSMNEITTVGLDLAKNVFQVHQCTVHSRVRKHAFPTRSSSRHT